MAANTASPTLNADDLLHYKTFSSVWWDDNGPFSGLNNLNELRVPMIRDCLIEVGIARTEFANSSKPLQGLLILDVGCGGGYLSEKLAALGCSTVAIDTCYEQIEVAKAHAALDPSLTNLLYLHEAIEDHSNNNFEKYDAVVASEVLDHVNEPEMFMEECIKCLKPGGSIFVSTFNRTFVSWLYSIVIAEYVLEAIPRGTHDWRNFFYPSETLGMLEKFKCKERVRRGFIYNAFNRKWYWTWFECFNYIIHAVKEAK